MLTAASVYRKSHTRTVKRLDNSHSCKCTVYSSFTVYACTGLPTTGSTSTGSTATLSNAAEASYSSANLLHGKNMSIMYRQDVVLTHGWPRPVRAGRACCWHTVSLTGSCPGSWRAKSQREPGDHIAIALAAQPLMHQQSISACPQDKLRMIGTAVYMYSAVTCESEIGTCDCSALLVGHKLWLS